jgi:hypothetical protein
MRVGWLGFEISRRLKLRNSMSEGVLLKVKRDRD